MKNIISEKSFEFAVKVVMLARELMEESREYELASQFMRSGTSIGANVAESQQAQSRKDFVSKMNIALKEAYETRYWLRLLERVDIERSAKYRALLEETEELIRILASIVKTSKGTNLN